MRYPIETPCVHLRSYVHQGCRYYCDRYGNVFLYDGHHNKWHVPYINKVKNPLRSSNYQPYDHISIRIAHSHSNILVHRLVAFCWIGLPNLFQRQIDHVDGDKHNNRADNLRWCSAKENTHFYLQTKKQKQK